MMMKHITDWRTLMMSQSSSMYLQHTLEYHECRVACRKRVCTGSRISSTLSSSVSYEPMQRAC